MVHIGYNDSRRVSAARGWPARCPRKLQAEIEKTRGRRRRREKGRLEGGFRCLVGGARVGSPHSVPPPLGETAPYIADARREALTGAAAGAADSGVSAVPFSSCSRLRTPPMSEGCADGEGVGAGATWRGALLPSCTPRGAAAAGVLSDTERFREDCCEQGLPNALKRPEP